MPQSHPMQSDLWKSRISICLVFGLMLGFIIKSVTSVHAEPSITPSRPVTQSEGLVTIESDVQQADNQTGIITATGNVRITYPAKGMVATSRQAQYFSKEGRLTLTGDVDVIDADGQRIRAEKLTYHLNQERLDALPAQGKQVTSKLRLEPGQGQRVGPPMP